MIFQYDESEITTYRRRFVDLLIIEIYHKPRLVNQLINQSIVSKDQHASFHSSRLLSDNVSPVVQSVIPRVDTIRNITRVLESLPGIEPVTAAKLIALFGDTVFEKLDSNGSELGKVLSRNKRKKIIQDDSLLSDELLLFRSFLEDHLTPAQRVRIIQFMQQGSFNDSYELQPDENSKAKAKIFRLAFSEHGQQIFDRTQTNPYWLCTDVGISFVKIDLIALALNDKLDLFDSRRIEAAMIYTFEHLHSDHCFWKESQLIDQTEKMLQKVRRDAQHDDAHRSHIDQTATLLKKVPCDAQHDAAYRSHIRDCFPNFRKSHHVVCELLPVHDRSWDRSVDTTNGSEHVESREETIYFPTHFYEKEVSVAKKIVELNNISKRDCISEATAKRFLSRYETAEGFKFGRQQAEAVITASTGSVTVITGFPGMFFRTIKQSTKERSIKQSIKQSTEQQLVQIGSTPAIPLSISLLTYQ